MNGCLDLYNLSRDFIYYNFAEVSKSDEFLQLSQSQLLQVMEYADICISVVDKVLRTNVSQCPVLISTMQPSLHSSLLLSIMWHVGNNNFGV